MTREDKNDYHAMRDPMSANKTTTIKSWPAQLHGTLGLHPEDPQYIGDCFACGDPVHEARRTIGVKISHRGITAYTEPSGFPGFFAWAGHDGSMALHTGCATYFRDTLSTYLDNLPAYQEGEIAKRDEARTCIMNGEDAALKPAWRDNVILSARASGADVRVIAPRVLGNLRKKLGLRKDTEVHKTVLAEIADGKHGPVQHIGELEDATSTVLMTNAWISNFVDESTSTPTQTSAPTQTSKNVR